MKLFGWSIGRASASPATPTVSVAQLGPAPIHRWDTGDKFAGGFGPTELLTADYWTLRARSSQLFETNLYARGLVRRLVTNEINTGLHLEATPEETLLGFEEDALADWSEDVENRFSLWESAPQLCDQLERQSFGALQCAARSEALISGDVLVVLTQDADTSLPRLRLVNGDSVRSPLTKPAGLPAGHKIIHGVELDANDRQVAYWLQRTDALGLPIAFERLAAIGPATGRRQAWLVYGTDKRHDAVRGKPMLSLVLQSLREIDRYRDSVQRKATLNAVLAMFIAKGEDRPGTRPLAGGAVRVGTEPTIDQNGVARRFNVADFVPGVVLDELQFGETPHSFGSQGTDERFGDFEEAIIQAVAWANEIPPEILRLSFSSNYSASQAAINEFKMYLNRLRDGFGREFCQPVYAEWLLSQALRGKVAADQLLEAWRDRSRHEDFAAWTRADWSGQIKPAVDMSKLVRGYAEMADEGFISRDRAARETTGTKFSKNVKKLKRENELLRDAMAPLANVTFPARTPLPADAPEDEDAPAKEKKRALVHQA